MKCKTNGLVSLLTSFIIGCAGPSINVLRNGVNVKYSNEKYFYHYIPIRDTGYYVMGKGEDKIIAEINAQEYAGVINEVFESTLSDLEKADELGKIRLIIEPDEYEELKFIKLYKNIRNSASK